MMRMLLGLIARDLKRKLCDKRLTAALVRLPQVKPRAPFPPSVQNVCVCALQVQAKLFRSLNAFVRETDGYLRDAAAQNADLVCFPEFFGVLLATISPAVRLLLRISGRSTPKPEQAGNAAAPNLGELLAPFSFLHERYLALMGLLTERYSRFVSCGTSLAVEDGRVYNRHTLLYPNGTTVCHADKIHLTDAERALGFSTGHALGFAELSIGRVALAVCMDATYYETFRAAKALGADYIILPIADMAAFDPWLALRGAQSRVSETGLVAVKAALVSAKGFPLTFSGKAGVYFPLEMGELSAESLQGQSRDSVITQLSLPTLRSFASRLFCRKNPAFDRAAFEAALQKSERIEHDAQQQ